MLRVDLEARSVEASVGALVADPDPLPRPGSPLALARTRLGGDVHRAWQDRCTRTIAGFEAEVTLAGGFTVDGFRVDLRGRADGVFRHDRKHCVVEEVKSVALDGAQLADAKPADFPEACRQVRLYALLLREEGARVEARLRLISIHDRSERVLGVAFRRDRAHQLLERLVRSRIERARRAHADATRRARIAEALRFPFDRPRPGQATLIQSIQQGLEAGRPVLVTAPTGTGKTAAALLPALRFSLQANARLFFVTAKTTQQTLVEDTFDALATGAGEEGKGLSAVTLRAKRGMCPPETLLCHPDRCRHLARFLDARVRSPVLASLRARGPRTPSDAVYRAGVKRTLCPYALQLTLLDDADLVIGDFNHVYDPGVAAPSLFDSDADRRAVVVIDEAHNLFDRARAYDSPFLAEARVLDLLASARGGALHPPSLVSEASWLPGLGANEGPTVLDDLVSFLEDLLDAMAGRREAVAQTPSIDGCRPLPADAPAWAPLAARAAELLVAYAHMNLVHGVVRADDPVFALLPDVLRLHAADVDAGPHLLPYVAASGAPGGAGVGVLCVDPARRLATRHREVLGTVAMSATLEPKAYFARVLGFAPLAPLCIALPSPFPEENRDVLIVPTVSTTWRERRHHYADIAAGIRDVATAREGNYVAYFPSFRFLDDVQLHLDVPGVRVLAQRPRMRERERRTVLDALRRADRPTLLLAVLGGIFGEGVDLPGEALVGAILVGPGLPPVGFEREAMRHYFDREDGGGFAYAMLYPGMQRVVQAAGRVHRTPADRGVVVLLGRRFAREPYIGCLPPHWYRYVPEEMVTGNVPERLRAFWNPQLPLRSS